MHIKNKEEFYDKYQKGLLGNKLRTFNNYSDIYSSGYKGLISIRYSLPNRPEFNKFYVPAYEIRDVLYNQLIPAGGKIEFFRFNESAPDTDLIIQGEYLSSIRYLNYSYEKANMRKAMDNSLHAEGVKAKLILRHFANDNSYSMLEDLGEAYPDSVIEFGIYEKCLGEIPGHNIIIWEVRGY